MCQFKTGDKVVRTGSSHSKIFHGQEYVVDIIGTHGDLYLKGIAGMWDPTLFALVPAITSEAEIMNKPHKHAENSASKKQPHVHAELIKAWADGAVIQYYNYLRCDWMDCAFPVPEWHLSEVGQLRIKPEPKPDRVEIRKLAYNANTDRCWMPFNAERSCNDPWVGEVKFTFDGETGKLKDAKVL